MQEHYSPVSADTLGDVQWVKSRRSGPQGNCVEFASLPVGDVAVRNSRDPHGTALVYPRSAAAGFVRSLKDGEFDDLLG